MEKEALVINDLVTACKRGDRVAAGQLYKRYSKAMYNLCLRMLNNKQEAEDVLQDSFYQVFKNIGNFRGEATVGAWIKRIVVNRCLNHIKKKKPLLVEIDHIEFEEEEPVDERKYGYTVEKVKEAIESLPDGYRIVLTLYLFEGYSHKEIAKELNISLSTAKTQYMRAKRRVRETVTELE